MLVLKRRKGQEIVIDGRISGVIDGVIRIRVVQTSDGSCSLAFEAPETHRIRRAELPMLPERSLVPSSDVCAVLCVGRGVSGLLQVQT